MRNYANLDQYLTKLSLDIYHQPEDKGHTALAQKVINQWMSRMTTCKSVLDLGCGVGFCEPMFRQWDAEYEGICLGQDYIDARDAGRNVKRMDYHFLGYEDNSFDMLFARHSLEHSPMPLLALMEWERVSRYWLGLILPAPEWYGVKGINHYSVMHHEQIENLVTRAGWKVLWKNVDYLFKDITDFNSKGVETPHEYWYMLEKATI